MHRKAALAKWASNVNAFFPTSTSGNGKNRSRQVLICSPYSKTQTELQQQCCQGQCCLISWLNRCEEDSVGTNKSRDESSGRGGGIPFWNTWTHWTHTHTHVYCSSTTALPWTPSGWLTSWQILEYQFPPVTPGLSHRRTTGGPNGKQDGYSDHS